MHDAQRSPADGVGGARALDEAPRHGFAVRSRVQPAAAIGQVWTVSRPLTYRAVDQLSDKGLVEAARQEPSDDEAQPNGLASDTEGTPGWFGSGEVHLSNISASCGTSSW